MIPRIISLIFFILQIGILGIERFRKVEYLEIEDLSTNILLFIFSTLQVVFGIWSTVLLVIGISEVQKLSIGKSIINLLISALIFSIPLLIYLFASK